MCQAKRFSLFGSLLQILEETYVGIPLCMTDISLVTVVLWPVTKKLVQGKNRSGQTSKIGPTGPLLASRSN